MTLLSARFLVAAFALSTSATVDSPLEEVLARHTALQDVSLVFEGIEEYVGPPVTREPLPVRYQGTFRYRDDGSGELDLYTRGSSIDFPLYRTRIVATDGRTITMHLTPDLRRQGADPSIDELPGNVMSLTAAGSYGRVLTPLFFQPLAQNSMCLIEAEGMDQVEGHDCLKLFVDRSPESSVPERWTYRFWIDMERGGNALKVETYSNRRLLSRTDRVRLAPFTSSESDTVWLPVKAVIEGFVWKSEDTHKLVYSSRPFMRETYSVVPTSVVVNQGMEDRALAARWDLDAATPGLETARSDFAAAVAAPPPEAPRIRTDPEGVREDLDRRLAEADQQARMLEASSASRGGQWVYTIVAPVAFLLGGGGVLAFAVIRKLRAA